MWCLDPMVITERYQFLASSKSTDWSIMESRCINYITGRLHCSDVNKPRWQDNYCCGGSRPDSKAMTGILLLVVFHVPQQVKRYWCKLLTCKRRESTPWKRKPTCYDVISAATYWLIALTGQIDVSDHNGVTLERKICLYNCFMKTKLCLCRVECLAMRAQELQIH